MVARSIFSYLRLERPRYRKTARRATARTVEEDAAVASLIGQQPKLYHRELVSWATEIYARQAFGACDHEVRNTENKE